MQRRIGIVVTFVGAFLLVVGILAQTYATGSLKKTPLDVNSTTHLAGEAALAGETFDVKVTSVTRTDSAKSTDDIVVFTNSSCVVKDLPGVPDCVSSDDPSDALITASIDDFATDRVSAEAVNAPSLLPADAVEHEGLVNKFPFDSQKRTYPYWDGTAGAAQDAEYVDTQEVGGVETYHYHVSVSDVPVEISDLPGLYSNEIDIFVEPITGDILNQTSDQARVLEDGTPVLAIQYGFTDAQIKASAEKAESNVSSLKLLTSTVPIVGYALGIPLLLVGIGLVLLGRRRSEENRGERRKQEQLTSA